MAKSHHCSSLRSPFQAYMSHAKYPLPVLVLVLTTYLKYAANGELCRGYWYDKLKYECCSDYELCLRTKRIRQACCGKHCYSEGNSLCCGGRLVDKCSQFHAECCGYRCIKADLEFCCNGVVVKKCGSKPVCCGGKCIDGNYYICCENHPVLRCASGDNAQCCGSRCYDKSHQRCNY